MEEYFNTEGCAAEQYEAFVGEKVRIYYQDMRGTNRSLIGTIAKCEGDNIWMVNGAWKDILNCANAKICIISTCEGWEHVKEDE